LPAPETLSAWEFEVVDAPTQKRPLPTDDSVGENHPMNQSRREANRVKHYVGVIWIDDKPGRRISVSAENPKAAREQVETEYGKGHVISLHSEEDAERPR
jgi:hypothetical protein